MNNNIFPYRIEKFKQNFYPKNVWAKSITDIKETMLNTLKSELAEAINEIDKECTNENIDVFLKHVTYEESPVNNYEYYYKQQKILKTKLITDNKQRLPRVSLQIYRV